MHEDIRIFIKFVYTFTLILQIFDGLWVKKTCNLDMYVPKSLSNTYVFSISEKEKLKHLQEMQEQKNNM